MIKTLITAKRKLVKSIEQRGAVSTGIRCVTRPMRRLADISMWMSPAFRRIRRDHAKWDKDHNVDTAPGNQTGWMADISSENWSHGRGYHPAPSDSLIQRISDLDIDHSEFTFIDFGSGKGRSLFAASNFPFKRIIGVEFNRFLHETAERNVEAYHSSEQQCTDLVPVHCDAANYEIPDGPIVYYFYDPFAEPVMRPVVDNMYKRLRESQEKCFVIYFNPVFAEYFEDSKLFARVTQGSEFENYWNRTRSGNKEANEFISELKDAERYVVYESTLS